MRFKGHRWRNSFLNPSKIFLAFEWDLKDIDRWRNSFYVPAKIVPFSSSPRGAILLVFWFLSSAIYFGIRVCVIIAMFLAIIKVKLKASKKMFPDTQCTVRCKAGLFVEMPFPFLFLPTSGE
jgi:hypothetical protein